jgi:hypothetical protein
MPKSSVDNFQISFFVEPEAPMAYPDLTRILINIAKVNKPSCLLTLRHIDILHPHAHGGKAGVSFTFSERSHWIEFLAYYRPNCLWVNQHENRVGSLESILIEREYASLIKLVCTHVELNLFDFMKVDAPSFMQQQEWYACFAKLYSTLLHASIRYFAGVDNDLKTKLEGQLSDLREAWQSWNMDPRELECELNDTDNCRNWGWFSDLRDKLEPYMHYPSSGF